MKSHSASVFWTDSSYSSYLSLVAAVRQFLRGLRAVRDVRDEAVADRRSFERVMAGQCSEVLRFVCSGLKMSQKALSPKLRWSRRKPSGLQIFIGIGCAQQYIRSRL